MTRTFTIECRRVFGPQITLDFKVEVYRLKLFGMTIWKRECLH